MANVFGISPEDERKLRARDTRCVYCGKVMQTFAEIRAASGKLSDQASIEHLNREGPFYVKDGLRTEDVVICCRGCNSSRGARELLVWFEMEYCVSRKINGDTVAEPVKKFLRTQVSGGKM